MTAVAAEWVVDEPGVFDDMPETVYHADPVPGGSLSASGAETMLDCPAIFRHEADNGRKNKAAYDFGHAAHKLVLGTGPEIRVVDAADFKTKAAKEQRDKAYADGAVPVLTHEYDAVKTMSAALKDHPIARLLFNPGHGKAEQSLFWVDTEFGVWCRARLDWLPATREAGTGRMVLVDYKTSASVAPGAISKSSANYGYHQQAAHYLDGVRALGLADDLATFIFVFQRKEPPHLVTVTQLDDNAIRIGRELNRRARERFRDCQQSGIWPGYSNDVELISLPNWYVRQHEENWS